MLSSGSLTSVRRLNTVARAMWERVERTDDQPGTGSATYCSAVSLRQASRTLRLAQRSYAKRATTSSCMRISPGLGQGPPAGILTTPVSEAGGSTEGHWQGRHSEAVHLRGPLETNR